MNERNLDPARDRWFLGTYMRFAVTSGESGGALSVVEQRAPAGFSPPLHVHAHEDGLMVVLEGELTVQVGDRRQVVRPGESAFLPRGVPHSFLVNAASRILEVLTPGGFEEFYRENGEPARTHGLPPTCVPDTARLVATAKERGVETLGPPMQRT